MIVELRKTIEVNERDLAKMLHNNGNLLDAFFEEVNCALHEEYDLSYSQAEDVTNTMKPEEVAKILECFIECYKREYCR